MEGRTLPQSMPFEHLWWLGSLIERGAIDSLKPRCPTHGGRLPHGVPTLSINVNPALEILTLLFFPDRTHSSILCWDEGQWICQIKEHLQSHGYKSRQNYAKTSWSLTWYQQVTWWRSFPTSFRLPNQPGSSGKGMLEVEALVKEQLATWAAGRAENAQ